MQVNQTKRKNRINKTNVHSQHPRRHELADVDRLLALHAVAPAAVPVVLRVRPLCEATATAPDPVRPCIIVISAVAALFCLDDCPWSGSEGFPLTAQIGCVSCWYKFGRFI